MLKFIGSIAIVVALLSATPAGAQAMRLNLDTKDPVTGLDAATWEALMTREVHADAAAGDDAVLVISSLPVPITLTCDRWSIVGPDVYKSVRGNPAKIEPFSVTYIKTKDFDGYCAEGIIGHARHQDLYRQGRQPGRVLQEVYDGPVQRSRGSMISALQRGTLGATAARLRVSLWLMMVSIILTALQMHPSFATLLVAAGNAGVLILMRAMARIEGRVR